MNIRCPHCQTLFRVDPARIPPRGIRARCARCGGTFQIAGTTQPGTAAASQSGPAAGHAWRDHAPASPGPAAAPAAAGPAAGSRPGAAATREATGPAAGSQPGAAERPSTARGAAPEQSSVDPAAGHGPGPASHGKSAPADAAASGQARPASAAPAPRGAPVFGSRDPNTRAQRIARALVSDIVAYHPERRDQAIEDGTLRSEFRDEIMKSWDEYVAQVGPDTAKSTPFFRQALNDILARGEAIF